MKAIVTGASGFLGSYLSNVLLQDGFEVYGIGRRNRDGLPEVTSMLLEGVNYIQGDLDNISELEDEIGSFSRKFDVLIHLAWSGSGSLSDRNVSAQVKNITRSIDLFQLAERLSVSRFVFAGTMEEAFAKKYLSLNFAQTRAFNRHVIYALSKLSARAALEYVSCHSNIEPIYCTNVHLMGVGDNKDSFLQVALDRILRGQPITMSSGEQLFDVIDVRDCATAYKDIVKRGVSRGNYFIGTGSPRPLRDFVYEMNSIFGPVDIIHDDKKFSDVCLTHEELQDQSFLVEALTTRNYSFRQTVLELASHLSPGRSHIIPTSPK